MDTQGPVWDAGEKTHRDENFPVASRLIAKRHRSAVLAFYKFARAADDVADNPELSEAQKIATLDAFEETLLGRSNAISDAIPLREAIATHGLSPRHGQDLLIAFRMDASKLRYATWDDLLNYCRYSASPVGRFVLDVHGESQAAWPANDALCTALQINNHLQDCGHDYRRLDRVYIPMDALAAHGIAVEALSEAKASPALRACLKELAAKTQKLLGSDRLSNRVADMRLSLEVAAIEGMARRIVGLLLVRDPLSENVHLSKMSAASLMATEAAGALVRRLFIRSRSLHATGQP